MALEHALGIGVFREAVFGVGGWELALDQTVSDLDRFWQAFFAYFARVFSLFVLVEQDGFGLTSRRRIWERFWAGCEVGVEEVLTEIACGAGGVRARGVARERESDRGRERERERERKKIE